ncbi:P-loop containing nucleoside triphosphate hydrolase protein [Apiospora rasikravindrae]|uniref:P-loop containing nucleoside triphosphate hydrolase protein n=1 Tax=Apiospora rasikravindrae TaxID=990691 RepID=A0ABR1TD14_9PEZI
MESPESTGTEKPQQSVHADNENIYRSFTTGHISYFKDIGESTTEDREHTMQTSIKYLEKKYDDVGRKYYSEPTADEEDDKKQQLDWWQRYALCETRHYYPEGDLKCTRLHVNPQPLKQLLEDVIGNYPNEPIDAQQDVEITLPAKCLFHYRSELDTEGRSRFTKDTQSLLHLRLLLQWIDQSLEDEWKAYSRAINSESKHITYEHLWTVFKPGKLMYAQTLGQPRAYEITNASYNDNSEQPSLILSGNYVDYDGEAFGLREARLPVPKFEGTCRLQDLNVVPLDLHPDKDQILATLLARGRRFEELAGQNHVQYSGMAVRKSKIGYERFHIQERIMVDCQTYHRLNPMDMFVVAPLDSAEDGLLLDEEAILANATVRGYAFTHQLFLEFFVDEISEIEWNTACFDQLVLDPTSKDSIQALVSNHARERQQGEVAFDDIVKGKGQGLIKENEVYILTPSFPGKTLTAECVAECVQRPLYNVSSGDLGTDSTALDAKLTHIMDLASAWNAVLLVDEADVFLSRRTLHDLPRNALVAVFLRRLEYYTGILFLTTNRVASFDDAFKSRIHVPLRFGALAEDSRRAVWAQFCERVGVRLGEGDMDWLAGLELNGRQIKNIVKTANSLASFKNQKLAISHLEQVAKIHTSFAEEFVGAEED